MRTVTVGFGHPCCTGVLCAHGDSAVDVDAMLRGGGERIVLRGTPEGPARAALVRRAREAGFREVVLATAAADRLEDAAGADVVRAVLFSHVPAVHDRLTGREGSLSRALLCLRRLRVPIEVEAPILPARLSDPRALVALARRAFEVRSFRFYVPGHEVPAAVAPPRLDAIAPLLAEAVAHVEARFDPSQGVPLCAFGDALHDRFDFSRRARPVAGRAPVEACEGCVVRHACGGPTLAYRARHGGEGLTPFTRWPKALTGRPPSKRPVWGPAEREAARNVSFLVLRPTIHCNQDCSFCSANESSKNAFEDDKAMLRAITRAAHRGVRRISFSGGEPTLSPSLPDYVSAARRLGVAEVEIVTNAVLLDRPGRVAKLAAAGLTHAFVSLHAHDEALSATMTQKRGDHARTLRGIEALLEAGVLVAVNHVITSRNRAYLEPFVEMLAARFGGRVLASFAFVTPQYKALEHPELVPKLSDTMPHLRRAMRRALALRQPFVVGARQGVPPCFLGPFAAWSDVFGTSAEAASEDAPQKQQGEACARCRYRALCPGLWRPYADRVGFDELVPVEGPPFDEAELAAIRGHHRPAPWGVPMSFEGAPPTLRDRPAETAPEPPPPVVRSLPVVPSRTRPCGSSWSAPTTRAPARRARGVGRGDRARRSGLAARAGRPRVVRGADLPERRRGDRGSGARGGDRRGGDRGARGAGRGLPRSAGPSREARRGHLRGLGVDGDSGVVRAGSLAARRRPAPRRLSLPAARAGRAGGLGKGAGLRARAPPALGAGPRPRRAPARRSGALHGALAPGGPGRRPRARTGRGGGGVRRDRRGRRVRRRVRLAVLGAAWQEDRGRRPPLESARGAEEAMIAAFRDAVLEGTGPLVSLAEGNAIEAAARALCDALEEAGAPLVRPGAPKHSGAGRNQRVGTRR